MLHSGRYIYISETNRSTAGASHPVMLAIMLLIFRRYLNFVSMYYSIFNGLSLSFLQLPPKFKDFAAQQTADGRTPSEPFMAYCAREFLHAQWEIILTDEEFAKAWKHGIVIACCDGLRRRFYPRIFAYSADYKEKYFHFLHSLKYIILIITTIEYFLQAFGI